MKQIYTNSVRSLACCLFMYLSVVNVMAQDRKVSGRITDIAGSGIPGATVVVKGTQMGTNTNSEGQYTLNVRSANDVLVISFVGYKTKEVSVGSQSIVDIKMDDDVSALEEVIVTGYTVDSRRETTGAVSTVK